MLDPSGAILVMPWCDDGYVPLKFRRSDAGRPPASELIDALLEEYDVIAGRALRGGPSTTPADFSPPGVPSSSAS
jgi:hypothetical protein